MNSKTVIQAIETNSVNGTQRVSGELSISQSSGIHHIHNLSIAQSAGAVKYTDCFSAEG